MAEGETEAELKAEPKAKAPAKLRAEVMAMRSTLPRMSESAAEAEAVVKAEADTDKAELTPEEAVAKDETDAAEITPAEAAANAETNTALEDVLPAEAVAKAETDATEAEAGEAAKGKPRLRRSRRLRLRPRGIKSKAEAETEGRHLEPKAELMARVSAMRSILPRMSEAVAEAFVKAEGETDEAKFFSADAVAKDEADTASRKMFKEADANGDGEIDFEEFMQMMK